jgi:hypothetical protein
MNDKKPIGIVLWRGKSLLDGERIAVVATGVYSSQATKNRKTGNMIQTYIIRRDIHPMLARRMGADYSICGDCMHREQSTCYVNLCHGPINVFLALVDGSYKEYEPEDIELFRDRFVRLGTYGDPAAVPIEVWENICKVAKGWTGYTHQWKKCDPRLKCFCMASVDSIERFNVEYEKAQSMGWRTFRVRESLDNPVGENEFVCPASKERGVLTNCEKCGCCSGIFSHTKKSPVIMLHADALELANWRNARYRKIMVLRRRKQAWRVDYTKRIREFKKVCPF